MKTKNLKAKAATLKNHIPTVGCTFSPAPNPSKKIQRQSDGKNDNHAAEIERIFDTVLLPHYQSFNLSTAIQLTSYVSGAESGAEVAEIFEKWARLLCKEGRLLKSPLFDGTYLLPRYENKRNGSEMV